MHAREKCAVVHRDGTTKRREHSTEQSTLLQKRLVSQLPAMYQIPC